MVRIYGYSPFGDIWDRYHGLEVKNQPLRVNFVAINAQATYQQLSLYNLPLEQFAHNLDGLAQLRQAHR